MATTIRVSLALSLSFLVGCGGPSSDGTTDSELSTIPSDVDPDTLYLLVEEQIDDTNQRSTQANQVRRAWHVLTWEVFEVLPIWLQSLCTDDPFGKEPVSLLGSLIQVPDGVMLYWDEAAGDQGALVLASSVEEVPEEHVDDLVELGSGSAERVSICHIPPGNPGNVHTLSISDKALDAHLAHGDFLGECADANDDSTDDGSVQGLTLLSVCSDAPDAERRWGVHNPNDFNVEVTWGVFGAFQTGVVVAPSGDSYFFTDTVEGDNTTVIIWLDGDGVEQSDVEASIGDQCEGSDSDGDGVSNAVDECPDTSEGEAVDEKGCACSQRDADSDGVHDCDDECPDTQDGKVDDRGCSCDQNDSDSDGVNDCSDLCLDTGAGVSVDATGCEGEDQVGGGCDFAGQNQAGPDSILVAPAASVDGASTTGQQYDFASVEVFIDPAVTKWIAWNNASDVAGTHPDYPEESFLGPGGFGTDDFIRVTIVAPDGTSLTKDIDKNNVSAENFGTQNIIFGISAAAPDVIRRNGFGGEYVIINEAGSHNSIFSMIGTYRFEFSFRDAFCCHAGHTDIYLLIGHVPGPDADGDCIPDSTDNCPLSANVDQQDSDQDGMGDVCDSANDSDDDGVDDATDNCPLVANADQLDADEDGTGNACDDDDDGDGVLDSADNCPANANLDQLDSDGDGVGDACDACPDDSNDGCQIDLCPADDNKTQPGQCGCGIPDDDTDSDGMADCNDGCPDDAAKTSAGSCGCGIPDDDTDIDGTADCIDGCPSDAGKIAPGICGCGSPDTDSDSDGLANCVDNCSSVANADQLDTDGDGSGDVCDDDDDGDGILDASDTCPLVPSNGSIMVCWDGTGDYLTIQEGIDAAVDSCDEVVICEGTYTDDGNRDLDFGGKAITVRSTDPNDVDVVAATIIDCQASASNRHRGFIFQSGEDSTSVLSGLTIANGYALMEGSDSRGGGIYCKSSSSPTIKNCVLTGNRSNPSSGVEGYGGGVYSRSSNPTITGCTVAGNSAMFAGGGIYAYSGSVTITDCVISSNSTSNSLSFGGGIFCVWGSPSISDSVITQNSVLSSGGGIYFTNTNAAITNCTISQNTAREWGGGISCDDSSASARPTITNCVISGNSVTWSGSNYGGGGIYSYETGAVITNCTISGNSAGSAGWGGGGILSWGGNPKIWNSILWNNTATTGPEISLQKLLGSSNMLSVSYCDIEGGQGAAIVRSGCTLNWNAGNIDQDPLFVNQGVDYHLQIGSPGIDMGNDDAVPGGVTTDRDGNPRFDGTVDIGAYEF